MAINTSPFAEDPLNVFNAVMSVADNNPVIRRVCLTSGGGDSTVLAHRCRDYYDELVHIDTGTALPGVRSFVEDFSRFIDKSLVVVEAKDAYRRLVLGEDEWWHIYYEFRQRDPVTGHVELPDEFRRRTSKLPTRDERMVMGVHQAPLGFPGPAGHKYAYTRLKERPLERMLRDVKELHGNRRRSQRVMLLSGVRLDESARRKMTGTAQGNWERRGNQLWVNPLLTWTNEQMRDYRRYHRLPVSDVTALVHRSGECNCLAFAAPGEREELISLFPTWYREEIQPIETEARQRGLERWQWGWGATRKRGAKAAGPMCSDCELRIAA